MIRLLLFLCVLALLALGFSWLLERPGDIVLTFENYRVETSIGVGLAVVIGLAVVLALIWTIVRTIFRLPSVVAVASRQRKRSKGYAALSRGMIAAGAGDVRLAGKSAHEAVRHLPDEPLALLLKAQAAQLAGDRQGADLAFSQMVERPATRLLGLRGLHTEAQRRGDAEAAHHFAQEAHKVAPLPWSAKAVLVHHAAHGRWDKAFAALESNIAAKLIDKKTGERHRAVLETALAYDALETNPEEALRLSRLAASRAPTLVPAVALTARLLSRKGDIRKSAKLIEAAWEKSPHPDLADVYLDLRSGDSNADRLVRAKTLLRLAPNEPESRMAVARAALAARSFPEARSVMAPLIAEGAQPTVRMCLIMAELEDAEHGATGDVRAWLARASRAPRDAVWMADGVAVDTWAPASPVTGQLDAFVWQRPPEGPVPALALHLTPETQPPEAEPSQSHALILRDSTDVIAAESVETAREPELSLPDHAKTVETDAAPAGAATKSAPKPVIFPVPVPPDDPGTGESGGAVIEGPAAMRQQRSS